MRFQIVAISDLHGTLPAIPACDLLLIGGDICPIANHGVLYQAHWLDTDFRSWLHSVPARQVVYIAGNHDFIFEERPDLVPRDLPAIYLQDAGCVWQGLRIWGSPWQPIFGNWAFNLSESELKRKWDLIPRETDILVLHSPPRGYGDGVPDVHGIRSTGSVTLLQRIEEIQPRLAIFGHIHEGRGQWQVGSSQLANVTILDARYQHVYQPWEYVLETADEGAAPSPAGDL